MPQLTSSPEAVVASTPETITTVCPDSPQFSTPQPSCPQPVFISVVIVGDPRLEVVPKPVGLIVIPAPSQSFSPQPSLPQPEVEAAYAKSPRLDVKLKPVNGTTGLKLSPHGS